MSDKVTEPTLLEELDRRQNQVLDELESLNLRIESLLDEYLGQRKSELAASDSPPSESIRREAA
jgi:hypothetical protein